jgi:hypothetical protein
MWEAPMPRPDKDWIDQPVTVTARVTNRVAKKLDEWVAEGGHASRAALLGSMITEIVNEAEESEK